MPLIQETDAEYHARTEISNSMLTELDPPFKFHAKYIAQEKTPRVTTDAMNEGAATHMLMLEPEQFTERFAVRPNWKRTTKDGKFACAWFAEDNPGKTILTTEQFDKCEAMAHAAFRHDAAADLLRRTGLNEVTVLFDYPGNHKGDPGPAEGIACRNRIDKVIPGDGATDGIIIDIKTARSASPTGFQRAITNFDYHRQAMFYRDGLAACAIPGYEGAADWPFVWIVIENVEPYCVGVYTMDEKQVERGRELHELKMFTLANCQRADKWPQYTNGIEILHLPPWAYSDFEPTEVIA